MPFWNHLFEPRREVVEALADVLKVRPCYLLRGGPRTDLEARAQLADAGQRVDFLSDPIWISFYDGIREGFGDGTDRLMERAEDGAVHGRGTMIFRTFMRVLEAYPPVVHAAIQDVGSEDAEGVGRRVAFQLGQILRYPFESLCLDPRYAPEPTLDEYVMAQCAALRHLLPDRQSRRWNVGEEDVR